jgi:hypothetical protein
MQVKKYEHSIATKKLNFNDKEYSVDLKHYKEVKQTYYQWIGFILLLQAGFFYLPRFIWKNLCEEGRIKELVSGIQSHVQDEDELLKRQEKVIEYIKRNKGHHLFYALKFFFCEILNFFNVIGQIFLTDWFLGHAFLNYGLQWLWYDFDDDEHAIFHPSFRYFPKETLCRVYSGSRSGAENDIISARCILPIQIFNEKIYLFLWYVLLFHKFIKFLILLFYRFRFYFIILAAISGLMIVYRVVVLLFPKIRYFLFARRAWATDEKILRTVVYDFDIGDWFIFFQIMRNMDPFVFGKLMKKVHEKILSGYHSPSVIGGAGEESTDELLSVLVPNAPYDIDEKHEKLNIQHKGYLSRKK